MHSKVIVVIDDDSEDQEVFIDAVKEIDNSIVCLPFLNGEEAVNTIKADGIDVPDFIFLDLNMPKFSGKQCLVELKKIQKLSNTPIIIYSTSADLRDQNETNKLGATYFLTKPSNFDELLKNLKKILI